MIASVKNVKLTIIPSVTPSGLLWLLPVAEAERTIGNSGQMHGAKIVTSPARNANPKSKIILIDICHPELVSGSNYN